MQYTADFETITTSPTRVWAYAIADIETTKCIEVGNNIKDFFNFFVGKKCDVYFHNLKFDGAFILDYLLKNGYTLKDTVVVKEGEKASVIAGEGKLKRGEIRTLITDMAQFYSIEVGISNNKKGKTNIVTFLDSLKKLPFSVKKIGKDFGLPVQKIDEEEEFYTRHREVDHEITEEEREYIVADVEVMANALKQQFQQGLTKMTIGADTMANYKATMSKSEFDRYYPVLERFVDNQIRQAYRGGFTYLMPQYKQTEIKEGIVFDVNSLYPGVMLSERYPVGLPLYYKGQYQYNPRFDLYILHVRFNFELKKDHIPCIQIKGNFRFGDSEYLESSNSEEVDLWLTSVDWELINEQYDVYVVEYVEGYAFESKEGLFNEYMEYWKDIKETSTGALRELAKLMLNNLYGKFGTNPVRAKKYPYIKNNRVYYALGDDEIGDGVFIPVACFVTSYARRVTISTAQKVYARFIYADTDSIHLIGQELPDIDIHNTRFGAWKCEGVFDKAKYIRQKTYMEHMLNDKTGEYHWDIKCAGMPANIKEKVTVDNFKLGSTFDGKKMQKIVEGGIILENSTFTLK